MQNWLEVIQDNPEAFARLDDIMNHTDSSEDGETLYVPINELAEVYAILFMASTGGAADLVLQMEDRAADGHVSGGAELVKLIEETEEGCTLQHLPHEEATHVAISLW